MREDRFVTTSSAGIIFAAGETNADRSAAFLAAFGFAPGDSRIWIDAAGHPLALSAAWTEGLDRYAAMELSRAGRAIAEPDQIRLVWKEGLNGSPLLTRRYIKADKLANIPGSTVVDVNKAGWRFATSRDSGFKLAELASDGEHTWPSTDG